MQRDDRKATKTSCQCAYAFMNRDRTRLPSYAYLTWIHEETA